MKKERESFLYGTVDEAGNIIIPGCIRNGVDEKSANKIYDDMAEFAKYAFNKSHATCYSVVAYRTAYLKYYYPVEFFCGLLNSVIDSQNSVTRYILECKNRKINILKPNINKSFAKFSVSNGNIVFGLAAIKNVGESAIDLIVNEREQNGDFTSLIDFCERVSSDKVNKKAIEGLIMVGSFDGVDENNRNTLLASFEYILDQISQDRRRGTVNQINIFDIGNSASSEKKYSYIQKDELSQSEVLSMEKGMLGFYISGHPLDEYKEEINSLADFSSLELEDMMGDTSNEQDETPGNMALQDGRVINVLGLVSKIRTKTTKNNDIMAFITVEDLEGAMDIIVFPKTYSQYKNLLFEDAIIYMSGRINIKEDEVSIVAIKFILVNSKEDLEILIERKKSFNTPKKEEVHIDNLDKESILKKAISLASNKNKKLIINIPEGLSEEQTQDLRNYIKYMGSIKGNMLVTIVNKSVSKDMMLYVDNDILGELYKKIGNENVRFV